MRQWILLVILTMFSANMLSPYAYAHICPEKSKMQAQSMPSMNADMPCHEEERKISNNCDGLCFCIHASLSQTLMTPDLQTAFIAPIVKKPWVVTKKTATSLMPEPPRRPPKTIS